MNIIPYLILVAGAALMLAASWRRGGWSPVQVGAWIVIGAMIGFGDLILGGILQVYRFHPGFLPHVMADHSLGALLADAWFVPVLLSSFQVVPPRFRLLVSWLLVLPIALIEIGCVRHGAFQYRDRWRLSFDMLLFLGYSPVSLWANWFEREGYTAVHRTVLTAAVAAYGWHVWADVTSGVLDLWRVRPHWLANAWSDQALGTVILHGLPFMTLVFVTGRLGWGRSAGGKFLVWATGAAYLYLLQMSRLWVPRPFWNPLFGGVGFVLITWLVSLLDDWFADRMPAGKIQAGAP